MHVSYVLILRYLSKLFVLFFPKSLVYLISVVPITFFCRLEIEKSSVKTCVIGMSVVEEACILF